MSNPDITHTRLDQHVNHQIFISSSI